MSASDLQILEPFYEGKAKVLYRTSDPGLIVQHFKDDATAFNRQKIGRIEGKGAINLKITAILYDLLEQAGVPTHFVRLLDERKMLVHKVQIVPLEVVVRNRCAGTFCKRYGVAEGLDLPHPIVELFYKDDALGDPLVTTEAAIAIGWTTQAEVAMIDAQARRVNQVLSAFFRDHGIELVDFKLEFGRDAEGNLLLADEVSPDSCRLWELGTGRKLDKDRFRQDLGGVEAAYAEVLRRLSP